MKTPKIKPNQASTFHRDGTLSYWSVYRQQWVRDDVSDVLSNHNELSAMTGTERARIEKAATKNAD